MKGKTLFCCNSVGAVIDSALLRGLSSSGYDDVIQDFLRATECSAPDDYPAIIDLDESVTGIFFDYEIVSINGGSFRLIQFPDTTDEQIKEAKRALRNLRDVVSLRVLRVKRMIDWNPNPSLRKK